MLIDDDSLSLKSLKSALQLNGFMVDAFNNPLVAWDKFKKKSYDLVMTDIMMEPIDGYRMLRLFLTSKPKIHIILFTGNMTNSFRERAVRIGADHFFNKPVPIEKIFNILHTLQKDLDSHDSD
ncbi:MAG: response regulator [Candidatus Marinimicrobia bacterium]|nr:response regulator [Candidatus Neomarinimicrobiota bacterium]